MAKSKRLTTEQRIEGMAFFAAVSERAAAIGHKLDEVTLTVVGKHGVQRYVGGCSCGWVSQAGQSKMQALKQGLGHLGDSLGLDARRQLQDRVALANVSRTG